MSTTRTWAIVPVKALAHAKRRLAPALSPAHRRRLVLTMLEDVLALLADTEAITRILVVTPDADVAALAAGRGAGVLREDSPQDLNAAVRSGLAHARSQGAERALVLPADVPLATRSELLAVLESGSAFPRPQACLVPSRDGEGTNALLLAPPGAIEPGFGPDSFVRHVAQAVALGLDFRVLRLPGLAADIDHPRELARLLAATRGSDRYAFLDAEIGRPRERRRETEP